MEPRQCIWKITRNDMGLAEPQAPLVLPETPPPPVAAASEAAPAPVVDNSNVIQLTGRARRWRNVASFTSAIAAALLVMMAMQVYQPDLFPDGIRPKPRTQVVEAQTPSPP